MYFELWHSKMKAALQSEWAFGCGRGEWQSLPVHLLHAAYHLHYLHAFQLCLTGGSIISWLIIHHTKVPVQRLAHLLSLLSCHSKVRGHWCACEVVGAVGLCETTALWADWVACVCQFCVWLSGPSAAHPLVPVAASQAFSLGYILAFLDHLEIRYKEQAPTLDPFRACWLVCLHEENWLFFRFLPLG